jgi:hypothetical protein
MDTHFNLLQKKFYNIVPFPYPEMLDYTAMYHLEQTH